MGKLWGQEKDGARTGVGRDVGCTGCGVRGGWRARKWWKEEGAPPEATAGTEVEYAGKEKNRLPLKGRPGGGLVVVGQGLG